MSYSQTGRTNQTADFPPAADTSDVVPLMLNPAQECQVVNLLTDRLEDLVRCKHFPSPEAAIIH